jgi:hypothetical protein
MLLLDENLGTYFLMIFFHLGIYFIDKILST